MTTTSDFGDTTNFGLGTKIEVLSGLVVRGSSFFLQSPPLSFIHQSGSGGYFTITDEKFCERENEEGRVCDTSSPTRQVLLQVAVTKT